jgi:hypothetical protein
LFTLSATGLPAESQPALGFASRPCDRFAFFEDNEAAGLNAGVKSLCGKHASMFPADKHATLGRPFGLPFLRLTLSRRASTIKRRSDFPNVKLQSLGNLLGFREVRSRFIHFRWEFNDRGD